MIRAFNADMPYDQFTREQLAGDLLPPERVDQLTATGFIRCGIATGEGGTIIEELRCNVKRERTEAYGAVFMGMTVGCAVCHDHKYDPITTKDFYGLTAFFNNLAEKPSTDDRADWSPNILVPTSEHRAAYDSALGKKAAVQRGLAARRAKSQKLIADWLAKGSRPKAVAPDKLALRLRLDENYQEGSEGSTIVHNSAPRHRPQSSPPRDLSRIGARKPGSGPHSAWRPIPASILAAPATSRRTSPSLAGAGSRFAMCPAATLLTLRPARCWREWISPTSSEGGTSTGPAARSPCSSFMPGRMRSP